MQMQHAPEAFSAFATFLGTPLPDDPITALRILRKEAAAEVERLLAFLDATDGDPDLEGEFAGFEAPQDGREDFDADFEPSLGAHNVTIGRVMSDGTALWHGQTQERDPGIDQLEWSCGGTEDYESEHDGREDGGDDEPDVDGEPSDNGIADADGLQDYYFAGGSQIDATLYPQAVWR